MARPLIRYREMGSRQVIVAPMSPADGPVEWAVSCTIGERVRCDERRYRAISRDGEVGIDRIPATAPPI